MSLYGSNMELFDGPLTADTAPMGIWFAANTYRGELVTQTVYPLENHLHENVLVPALPVGIATIICGKGKWILYKG